MPPMSPAADRTPRFDARLRACLRAVTISAGVLAAAAGALLGATVAVSVAIGGVIAVANLWALARIVLALLPGDAAGAQAQQSRGRGGWALVAVAKMLGLVAVVWLLMRHGHAFLSPLPLLVGFGALPIGIAIGSLLSDRSSPDEGDSEPLARTAPPP